jgi:putative membrane protein
MQRGLIVYAHLLGVVHPDDIWSAWTFEPVVVALLAVTAIAYAAGVARLWNSAGRGRGITRLQCLAFAGGWLTLCIALVSPIHALGGALFSAHMAQHELLLGLATPLMVIGRPLIAFVWALSANSRRSGGSFFQTRAIASLWRPLSTPLSGFLLHALSLGVWHLPRLYQATLGNEWVHAAQHTSFILSGALFWWTMLSARGERTARGRGAAIGFLFATVLVTGALGALLTFSGSLWYPVYASTTAAWGLTPLEDQQLGGMIMWVPGGIPYLIAALALLAEWLRESGRSAFSPRASTVARGAALLIVVALAGCDRASGDDSLSVAGGDAARAPAAIRKYGCGSCHAIPGIRGADSKAGPPLEGIRERLFIAGVLPNTPENMVKWIENPPATDPKTAMPNLGVSGRDARDISAYLYGMK